MSAAEFPSRVVVLDPDNRQQMEKFASLHDKAWQVIRDHHPDRVGTPTWEIYAMMLRLLNESPDLKPPEPTGLGAVVEDAEGDRWTRVDGDAISLWHHGGRFPKQWRDIDAVRVLSDGVTDDA